MEDVRTNGKPGPHPSLVVRIGADAHGHEVFLPYAVTTQTHPPDAAVFAEPPAVPLDGSSDALQARWVGRLTD